MNPVALACLLLLSLPQTMPRAVSRCFRPAWGPASRRRGLQPRPVGGRGGVQQLSMVAEGANGADQAATEQEGKKAEKPETEAKVVWEPKPLEKPRSLSPSALNDFKVCPLLFRFRHLDRLPEPVTPVLARGTCAHDALYEFYGLSRELRSLDNLQNLFRLSWLKAKQGQMSRNADQYKTLFATVEDERKWGLHGLQLLQNYLELEDPTTFEPLSRELPLVTNITADVSLHGIIDRVDVDDDGNLAVVDYKTGKAPDLKYGTAVNRKILDSKFLQLRAYALLLEENYGRAPTVLKLLFLDGPSLLWMPCNHDEVERAREEILVQWESILYRVNRQHFEPNVNRLCAFCTHKPICPAWQDDSSKPTQTILQSSSSSSSEAAEGQD